MQTCPDSVKIKASKSPWLWTLFLPNLTLFLDSGHFNQSEWDRLEHFPPPFGFMELNFSCESSSKGPGCALGHSRGPCFFKKYF